MTKQSIKYQETTISPDRSIAEITELLRRHKVGRVETTYGDDGAITGFRFALKHAELGSLAIALEPSTATIEKILKDADLYRSLSDSARAARIKQQAERIAWRHLKDWLEQQLLAVELGLRSLEGTFMGDVEVNDPQTGQPTTMGTYLARYAQSYGGRLLIRPPRAALMPPEEEDDE